MMTSKGKLFTESEIGFERVIEVRIRDLRERGGNKQRSFSLSVRKGTKNDEYGSLDDIKNIIENAIRGYKP
jgi:hypothetical protein